MDHKRNWLAAGLLPLLLGLGACTAAVGADDADAASGPLTCTVDASTAGGMITLSGIVHADKAVSGTYSFRVTGSGTDIEQGGGFSAGPGAPATLGQVMLGGNGSLYKASLRLTAGGKTVSCSETVGGPI